MAQGTSRSKNTANSRGSGSTKPSGGPRSGASARGAQSQARAPSSRARSAAARRRTSPDRSSESKRRVESVKDTVGGGTERATDSVTTGVESAGDAVSRVAKKAKGPALAGGAALAGLAGGLAIAARGGGPRKVLGVPVPGTRRPLVKINTPRRAKARGVSNDLLKAANEVGTAGRHVGDLVTEVQRVRTELDHGQRRSPLEVLLEGLTSRRVRG